MYRWVTIAFLELSFEVHHIAICSKESNVFLEQSTDYLKKYFVIQCTSQNSGRPHFRESVFISLTVQLHVFRKLICLFNMLVTSKPNL